jgi:hypothetical protein
LTLRQSTDKERHPSSNSVASGVSPAGPETTAFVEEQQSRPALLLVVHFAVYVATIVRSLSSISGVAGALHVLDRLFDLRPDRCSLIAPTTLLEA